jgi:hypothetical protein
MAQKFPGKYILVLDQAIKENIQEVGGRIG